MPTQGWGRGSTITGGNDKFEWKFSRRRTGRKGRVNTKGEGERVLGLQVSLHDSSKKLTNGEWREMRPLRQLHESVALHLG